MDGQQPRIVFLGTHGQRNIGDELLLETFLRQLGSQNHYVINTYDKAFTGAQLAGRYSVELIDTAGDRVRLLRELLRCDLLCFGGGSIIKELYASTGRHRYSTLAMILAVVGFAHLVARKPIAMLNVGVGPIRTPAGRRLARLILSQVDLLSVRDAKSYATCLAIGLAPERVVLGPDAVFSAGPDWLSTDPHGAAAPVATPPARDAMAPVAGRPVRVALNLNFHIANPDSWEPFLDQLAAGLLEVHREQPVELHALPMQTGFKAHDDAEVLAAFAERVPGITMVQHRPTDHAEVAGLLAGCDLLVSERLHAIVIAAVLGVPTLVLAYDVKVLELAAMLGLEAATIDINAPFAAADVSGRLSVLLGRHDEARADLLARSTALRSEARSGFEAARRWVAGITGRAPGTDPDAQPVTVQVGLLK